jgi:predicted PurR-regulated permease PerM
VRRILTWALPLSLGLVLLLFHAVMLPFILGVLIAYVLAPVVNAIAALRIGRGRLPRGIAVILVYLGLAASLTIFLLTFLPRVSSDFARLIHETPRFLKLVRTEYVPRADAWVDERLEARPHEEPAPTQPRHLSITDKGHGHYEVDLSGLELEIDPAGHGRYVVGPRDDSDEPKGRLSDLLNQATRSTENEFRGVLETGQRLVRGILRGFAWFVLSFMVAAYLLVDIERVMSFLRSLAPPGRRADFDELTAEMDRGLAGVVRGQLLICVVNGVLTTVGLVLFHVKYALLLGLLASGMSFIPVFGSILSSVPIVAIALASGGEGASLSTGFAVLLWIIGIHFLEANLFNPKIIGDTAKIHPVVVVFALLVGEETGGLAGALVAVPTVSILQAVFLWMRKRSHT